MLVTGGSVFIWCLNICMWIRSVSPSRCKETQIKILPVSCYLTDESEENGLENPLGQRKKKDNLSTLTYPVCPATQPAHNSVSLIESQLSLHVAVRGGEGKLLWMSLKAQTICSPIFRLFFFTFLLHKPVSPPHLTGMLHAQVSDLISCIIVCANNFNFCFQRHCKVWSKQCSCTSWQEGRKWPGGKTFYWHWIYWKTLRVLKLILHQYECAWWTWGEEREEILSMTRAICQTPKELNRNQIGLCSVQGYFFIQH